jgi:hypothetical protein
MKKSYEKHMEKKQMLSGKRIVGIDPGSLAGATDPKLKRKSGNSRSSGAWC